MKSLIQTLFFFLLVAQISFAQQGWINRSKPGCSALVSVYFANEDIGWAVSLFSYGRLYKSHILKTSDGGMTWTQQNSEALDPLFDIYFTNDMEGITVGSGGKIFRTTDAGENWVQQSSGTVLSLNSICSIDANNIWVVGGGENIWAADTTIILHSTDGGVSWVEQASSNLKSLFDVHFINSEFGITVGNGGTILNTTNGGSTWISQNGGTSQALYSVSILNTTDVIVVGDSGTILKSSNGGITWIPQSNVTTSKLGKVFFLDSQRGWIISENGELLITVDSGSNWSNIFTGTYLPLHSIYFFDSNNGIVVGGYSGDRFNAGVGIIIKTEDGGMTWESQTGANRWLSDVSFFDSNVGIAVGSSWGTMLPSQQSLLRTTDGGKNWIFQSLTTGGSAAYCINSTVAFAVGIWSIHKTIDVGTTWTEQTSGYTGEFLFGASFTDANNGTVVGSDGTILRTINGGTDWIPQTSGIFERLWDVTLTDANNGWVVGDGGTILRTTDGGENWVQQSSGTVLSLNSICSIDANNIWVVGGGDIWAADTSIILHSTDGGVSWVEQASSNLKSLFDIIFTDTNNGWVVGNYGTILRTTNGGTEWIPQTSGTTNALHGVYFIDALNGWAVGVDGTILQTTNGGVPVELTSFTAITNGKEVILNWTTATELNNQGFEIERSEDKISFNKIGFIPGFGTTTEPKSYSYTDQPVSIGKYYYRLKQVDYDGSYEYSDVVEIEWRAFNSYLLEQNFPNPFNPSTTIGFGIQNKSNVKITILNAIGEEVAVVLNEEREPGFHQVEFNATNLPSGVYFYRLQAGSFTETKKMLLLK